MSIQKRIETLKRHVAPVTSVAREAAADIVKTQVAWNNLLWEGKASGLISPHLIGYGRAICGATLLDSVVPFLHRGAAEADELGQVEVPLDVLLGDSWRWTTDCVDAADQDRLESWLSHPDRSDLGARDAAVYCVVPALGIYWAHEGKNRVQFLRDRGLSHVPANLSAYPYPAADRIKLFKQRVLGRDELWAVLDSRWVQPILISRLGTPVLREYGVPAASRWPVNWPDARAVSEQMYRDVDPNATRPFNCVDLHPLEARRREKERGYEQIEASIIELDGFRFKIGPLVALAIICVVLSIAGAAVGSATGGTISGFGFGALCTLFGLMALPLVRTKRRNLDSAHQGRPDHHDLSLEPPTAR